MTDKKKKMSKIETKKTKKVAKENTTNVPRLSEKYKSEILPNLLKQFSYKSKMQVPKLEKIVVNMGLGGAVQDSKLVSEAVTDLETIIGQKALIRKAKVSISNFKLREGMEIGAKVTLRRNMMFEFLDRLISVAMPRI
ncbi:MAG: 50S ribosomal protein L5, partial [Melioribacteraceae bacterium]